MGRLLKTRGRNAVDREVRYLKMVSGMLTMLPQLALAILQIDWQTLFVLYLVVRHSCNLSAKREANKIMNPYVVCGTRKNQRQQGDDVAYRNRDDSHPLRIEGGRSSHSII